MIDNDSILRIKEIDILSIAQKYITNPIKKQGANYVTKCIWHQDNDPSLSISPRKNIARCFVCGKTVNGIGLVADVKGFQLPKDYTEVLKEIASAFNITIKENNKPKTEKEIADQQDKEAIYIANQYAADWYHHNLLNEWDDIQQSTDEKVIDRKDFTADYKTYSLIYIRDRFTDLETVNRFKIGYAPQGYNNLYKEMIAKGYKEDILAKSGLIKRDSPYSEWKDFFINRPVIIPILNPYQKVVSMAARELPDIATLPKSDGKHPKYMNGPETATYKKGDVIYGLDSKTVEAIRKSDRAYVVEGYLDKIKLARIGIENVIAKCGTALTESHIKTLKRYTKNITIIGDGDEAGRKSNIANGELLTKNDCEVAVLPLPDKQDPDSFFTSKEQFTDYRKKEELDFIIDVCAIARLNNTNNTAEIKKITDETAALLYFKTEDVRSNCIKRIVKNTETTTDAWKKAIATVHDLKKAEQLNVRKKEEKSAIEIKAENTPENRKRHDFYFVKTDKDGAFKGIDIDELELLQILKDYEIKFGEKDEKSLGFFIYQIDDTSEDFFYIHLRNGRIKKVNPGYIMKIFLEYVRTLKPYEHEWVDGNHRSHKQLISSEMIEKIVLKRRAWFKDDLIRLLHPDKPISIIEDTKDEHYTFFNNCYIIAKKGGYKVHGYETLKDAFIWEDQILDRDFHDTDSKEPSYLEKFICDVSGNTWNVKENKAELNDEVRFKAFKVLAGYLLHSFMNRKLKMPILTDSRIGEGNMGRGGKTLFVDMIGECGMNRTDGISKTYVSIDGKELKADNKHKYEQLDRDTKMFQYNDPKNLNFEDLFVGIEKGWNVDPKNEKPFKVKCKAIITTNKPIERDDESSIDRSCVMEVVSCFSANNGPDRKYGIWFGRDFTPKDWQLTDVFMQRMLVEYFDNDCELIEPASVNLHRRELLTFSDKYLGSDTLVFWLDDKFKNRAFKRGEKYDINDLRDQFAGESGELTKDDKRLRNNFTKVLNFYLKKEGYKAKTLRSHGKAVIEFEFFAYQTDDTGSDQTPADEPKNETGLFSTVQTENGEDLPF